MRTIHSLLVFRDEELDKNQKLIEMETDTEPPFHKHVVGYVVFYKQVNGVGKFYHALKTTHFQHMYAFIEANTKLPKNAIYEALREYYQKDVDEYNDQCDEINEKIKSFEIMIDSFRDRKVVK